MKIVFLLEEPSMKEFLDIVLPKILPDDIKFTTIKHNGKSDLKKSLTHKLKSWNEPNSRFVIIQDKDSADCMILKQNLLGLCNAANKEASFIVRIACTELESWYFGDIEAVEKAYNIDLSRLKSKAKFRFPDKLGNPKQELLKIVPYYQPISGAKLIGKEININNNKSQSFKVFVSGVKKLIE